MGQELRRALYRAARLLERVTRPDPRMDPLVTIGEFTYGRPLVLRWASGCRVSIGKFCSIADEVIILAGGNHRTDWVTTYPLRIQLKLPRAYHDGHPASKGDVIIGSDVWIGTRAIILSGTRIGDGAVVAAGAVVTKPVPPYAIVAGNPARVVRMRFSEEQINQLLEVQWWNWPVDRIVQHVDLLCSGDVDAFLRCAQAASEPPGG